MYYACYKLSCMGWNVMPTARNARGIDIIAYNKEGTDFIGVQVKALSKRNPVPLGNSLEKVMGDFWLIAVKKRVACLTGCNPLLMISHNSKRLGIVLGLVMKSPNKAIKFAPYGRRTLASSRRLWRR